MLSVSKLRRSVASERWAVLLADLVRNGCPLALRVRALLGSEPSVEMAALGLALQRAVELSWGPSDDLGEIAARLCACVESAELGVERGTESGPSAGAIGVAARGLWEALDTIAARGWKMGGADVPERLSAGLVRCGQALLAAQVRTALSRAHERGLVGTRLDSAIVMWQLGALELSDERALWLGGRRGVDMEYLREGVERAGLWNDAVCAELMERAGLMPIRRGGSGRIGLRRPLAA